MAYQSFDEWQDDMSYVRRVVRGIHRGRSHLDADEMESDGMLALTIAAEKWETTPSMRASWGDNRKRYVSVCVERRIIDGLRNRNGTTQEGRNNAKYLSKMASISIDSDNREASNVASEAPDDQSLSVEMKEMVSSLRERERETIERTIVGDESARDVASSWGVSDSRVGQIRRQALDHLANERTVKGQPLSPRELQVLEKIASGDSNVEIAASFVISTETVKSHVQHILSKMGARTRSQAVTIGFRQHLLH